MGCEGAGELGGREEGEYLGDGRVKGAGGEEGEKKEVN